MAQDRKDPRQLTNCGLRFETDVSNRVLPYDFNLKIKTMIESQSKTLDNQTSNTEMSKNLSKYLHQQMDKEAGIQHTFHRTKIVATVGPACDTYEKLLELVK